MARAAEFAGPNVEPRFCKDALDIERDKDCVFHNKNTQARTAGSAFDRLVERGFRGLDYPGASVNSVVTAALGAAIQKNTRSFKL